MRPPTFLISIVLLMIGSSTARHFPAEVKDDITTTTWSPPWPSCWPSGSAWPNFFDCSAYFRCIDGHTVEQFCDDGLHFDWESGHCDLPSIADCQASITTDNPSPTSTSEGPICEEGSVHAIEIDCSSYFRCHDQRYVEQSCPDGLHFDREHGKCDLPSVANCQQGGTTGNPTATSWWPSCFEGITLPNDFDCSAYYRCIDGRFVEQTCDEGLHFDWRTNNCVLPSIANCQIFPSSTS